MIITLLNHYRLSDKVNLLYDTDYDMMTVTASWFCLVVTPLNKESQHPCWSVENYCECSLHIAPHKSKRIIISVHPCSLEDNILQGERERERKYIDEGKMF